MTTEPGTDPPSPPHQNHVSGSATQALLRDLLADPLGSAYSKGDPHHEATLLRKVVSVALVAALTAVSVWATLELRRVRSGTFAVNQELVADAQGRRATLDELESEIALLDSQITARQELLAPLDPAMAAQTQLLGAAAGTLAISGPGIVIELDDSSVTRTDGNVRDIDLQVVTNSLWQAGSEGIAINGERLTSTTALRSAGEAILVNLVPLSPPYRIEAIGDPAQLQAKLSQTRAAGHLAMLRDSYGVRVTIELENRLTLAAGSRPVTGSLAQPLNTEE